MKKRFISLVAAALVGGVAAVSMPATSSAGTVELKGDTQVQMYGFLRYTGGWTNDMDGTATSTNVPYESTDNKYHKRAETRLATQTGRTRLGFNFKNEDANLTGKLEGDFGHATNFRLRRAFVKHNFDNFYVLIGQEWGLEKDYTFSQNHVAPAGMSGYANGNRIAQVQIGTNLDLGGAALDLKLALENNLNWVSTGKGLSVTRKTFPGIATRATLKVNTGFGNPAQIYAFATAMPVKIQNKNQNGDQSETPYIFGAGFNLPVSMVTLQSEYVYAKGANGFAGLISQTPASYYYKGNDLQKNSFYAYNIEAKVAPMPNVSVAGGYTDLKFDDDTSFKDDPGNTASGFDKPEYQTYFGNVVLNTTKYTTLVLEWDHVKHSADGNYDSQSGDQYWLSYTYNF